MYMVPTVRRVVDVPITFRDRVAGESKLSMKQNVLYLRQLMGLYWDMCYPTQPTYSLPIPATPLGSTPCPSPVALA